MSYELTAPSRGRYDSYLEQSESYADVVETGHHARAEQSVLTVSGASDASFRQFSMMMDAASTLAKHCSENAEDLFDVHDVSAFLNLPLTLAHGLIDVLDVLEIIRPRGNQYLWRGTAHVPMMLKSSTKFQAGATMATGVAVPKVCRAMIPHLQNNEGVVFTSSEMAALLWQTQDNPEDVGEYAANQQQRALSGIVRDVLAVFAGLEHIQTETKEDGTLAFKFMPKEQPTNMVSPRGQTQSSRMRSMRILFDGPAENGTPPRTVAPISRPSSANSARGPNSARDAAAAERALAEITTRPSSAAPRCPASPVPNGVPSRPVSRGSISAVPIAPLPLPLERSASYIHCPSPHRVPSRPGSAHSHSSGVRGTAPPIVPPINLPLPYNPPSNKRLSYDSATAANAAAASARASPHQLHSQPSFTHRPSSASNRLPHQGSLPRNGSLPRQASLPRQPSLSRAGSAAQVAIATNPNPASAPPPPQYLSSQSSMNTYDRHVYNDYENQHNDLSPMSQQRAQYHAPVFRPNTSPVQYHQNQNPSTTSEWCGMQQELTSHCITGQYSSQEPWPEASMPTMEHSMPRLPVTPPRITHERSYAGSRSPVAQYSNYNNLAGYPTAPPLQHSMSVMDAGSPMNRYHNHEELQESPSAMQLPYGRSFGGAGGYFAMGRRATTSHRTTSATQRPSLGRALGGTRGYTLNRHEGVTCEETVPHWQGPGMPQMPQMPMHGARYSEGMPLPEPSRAPLSPRVENKTVGDVKQLKHMFETTRISQIQPFKLPHTRVRNMVRKMEVHGSPVNEQEA